MTLATALRHPVVLLRVDGEAVPFFQERLVSFEYTDRMRKRDACNMVFADPDRRLANTDIIQPNAMWEVRWGYRDNLSGIRTLTLKSWKPAYNDKFPVISIEFKVTRGRVKENRPKTTFTPEMHRVRIAKHWGKKQSSDIAKAIAKRHRLKVVVDESEDVDDTPFVQSENVSDYEYLDQLAWDIDFEFFIENGTLYYRKKPYDERPRRVLFFSPHGDTLLKSFQPEVKIAYANVKPRGASDKKTPTEKMDDLIESGLNFEEQERLRLGLAQTEEDLSIHQEIVVETSTKLAQAEQDFDLISQHGSAVDIATALVYRETLRKQQQVALDDFEAVKLTAEEVVKDIGEAIVSTRQETLNGNRTDDGCNDGFEGTTPTGDHQGKRNPGRKGLEYSAADSHYRKRIDETGGPSPVGVSTAAASIEVSMGTPETSKFKQRKIACAAYGRYKDSAVTADGTCVGDPSIRAKVVYEIQGVGSRFTGSWYALEAKHIISDKYEVSMKFKRGTLKKVKKGKGTSGSTWSQMLSRLFRNWLASGGTVTTSTVRQWNGGNGAPNAQTVTKTSVLPK